MAKSSLKYPRRGDVFWLHFTTSTGHEMAGPHPCVIVQNDVGNRYSGLTIVATITTNLRVALLPIGVRVKAGEGGLVSESVINCGHLYTVDKSRLGKRLGKLSPETVTKLNQALLQSLALVA